MLIKSNQANDIFHVWGIQVEKRSLWMGQFWLFVTGIAADICKKNIENAQSELIELCETEKALFLQIEILDYSGAWVDANIVSKYFTLWSYKQFIYPNTALIDLTQTEDEILAKMKPKWRYNIKVAKKRGIEVREVDKTDEYIQMFCDLMNETTSRDNFSGHTFDYYKQFLESLENSFLLLAFKEGRAIAGGIFVTEKHVTLYYYWASTSHRDDRKDMAPYLIQWEAISKAKQKKSELYDFLWVAPKWSENHSLQSVTDFKKKFTSDLRTISTSYMYIHKPLTYTMFWLIKKMKNMFS